MELTVYCRLLRFVPSTWLAWLPPLIRHEYINIRKYKLFSLTDEEVEKQLRVYFAVAYFTLVRKIVWWKRQKVGRPSFASNISLKLHIMFGFDNRILLAVGKYCLLCSAKRARLCIGTCGRNWIRKQMNSETIWCIELNWIETVVVALEVKGTFLTGAGGVRKDIGVCDLPSGQSESSLWDCIWSRSVKK